jgi:transcriptional regulator with XRE-family HTH domain
MAAVEQVLSGNMPDPAKRAMLTRIGVLAAETRSALGLSTVKLAKAAGLGSDRTVRMFESAATTPEIITQRKLEDALGWKRGVIRDLLAAAEDGSMTAADVDMDYVTGFEPASRASELDDSELLVEVIKRLERWQTTVEQDPPAVTPIRKLTPAQEQWNQFGLAADAVPGIKERRTKPAPKVTDE